VLRWLAGFPFPEDWQWITGPGCWLVAQAREGGLGFLAERRPFDRAAFAKFVQDKRLCWHVTGGRRALGGTRRQTSSPIVAGTSPGCATLQTSGTFLSGEELVSYAAVAASPGDDGFGAGAPDTSRLSVAVLATSPDSLRTVEALAMAVARAGALGAGAADSLEALARLTTDRARPSAQDAASAQRPIKALAADARILGALAVARGNKTRAAERVGMSRPSFIGRLKRRHLSWKDR